MLVRMMVGLCGPTMSLEPGDERDFPKDEAIRLIKAGYAVPVAEDRIERAVVESAPEIRVEVGAPERIHHRRRHKVRR